MVPEDIARKNRLNFFSWNKNLKKWSANEPPQGGRFNREEMSQKMENHGICV